MNAFKFCDTKRDKAIKTSNRDKLHIQRYRIVFAPLQHQQLFCIPLFTAFLVSGMSIISSTEKSNSCPNHNLALSSPSRGFPKCSMSSPHFSRQGLEVGWGSSLLLCAHSTPLFVPFLKTFSWEPLMSSPQPPNSSSYCSYLSSPALYFWKV